jgi:hypothetical protein
MWFPDGNVMRVLCVFWSLSKFFEVLECRMS